MNMIISYDRKYMKQSSIEHNTELLNMIGLETNAIPSGKYITHEKTYVNDFNNINENHYYRVLDSVEMDLSETDKEITDYMKFGIFINERRLTEEKTQLGEFNFFTIPNLNDKYLIQRNLTDFYKYDSEFNSYDNDLDMIINDTNNKVDLIIKRIFDFIKVDDDTTTAASTTPDITAETTPDTTITTDPDTTQEDPDNGCFYSMNLVYIIIIMLLFL